jgi:hypothetical protein
MQALASAETNSDAKLPKNSRRRVGFLVEKRSSPARGLSRAEFDLAPNRPHGAAAERARYGLQMNASHFVKPHGPNSARW